MVGRLVEIPRVGKTARSANGCSSSKNWNGKDVLQNTFGAVFYHTASRSVVNTVLK
jgi:hypothetical protein